MPKTWTPGPYPEFSWAYSRDECFEECSRKYYWTYYGYWKGWSGCADGTDEQRQAYRLTCLTGLHQVLGSAVHHQAKASEISIRDGEVRPVAIEMAIGIGAAIRRVCTTPREVFLANPKKHPITQSQEYRERLDSSEMKGVLHNLPRCVENLAEDEMWGWIDGPDPEEILVVDQLAQYHVGDIPLWLAVFLRHTFPPAR